MTETKLKVIKYDSETGGVEIIFFLPDFVMFTKIRYTQKQFSFFDKIKNITTLTPPIMIPVYDLMAAFNLGTPISGNVMEYKGISEQYYNEIKDKVYDYYDLNEPVDDPDQKIVKLQTEPR